MPESTITPPELTHTPAQPVAMIHVKSARSQIMNSMTMAFNELGSLLQSQRIAPAGPWFAHHLRRPTESFDFNLCIPVAAPIQPTGRITNGERRSADVARTTYTGPYSGLPDAWGEFVSWVHAHDLHPAEDLWEVYTVGPRDNPDAAHWQTELNLPLTDQAAAPMPGAAR